MRLHRTTEHRRVRIEIIPLIDCMFFLVASLVYAMLWMVVHHGVNVSLPAAYTAQTNRQDYIGITITEDSSIYFDKQKVTAAELPARVKAAMQGKENVPVFVSGDRRANLGVAIEVLDLLRRAGIKEVSFETTEKQP